MPTKQPMPPVPPLQPLLFWETGVLLFVAGIVTARFPVPALTACALFAWVDSRTRRPLCCLLTAACVISGWWIGEKFRIIYFYFSFSIIFYLIDWDCHFKQTI